MLFEFHQGQTPGSNAFEDLGVKTRKIRKVGEVAWKLLGSVFFFTKAKTSFLKMKTFAGDVLSFTGDALVKFVVGDTLEGEESGWRGIGLAGESESGGKDAGVHEVRPRERDAVEEFQKISRGKAVGFRKAFIKAAAHGFALPPADEAMAANGNEVLRTEVTDGPIIAESGVELFPELAEILIGEAIEFGEGFELTRFIHTKDRLG